MKIIFFGSDDFAEVRNNVGLYKACLDHYVNSTQYREAFKYLQVLKENNMSPKECRAQQEATGEGLSFEDRTKSQPKSELVLAYTGDDKWFRYFRKSYLKQQ